MSDSLPDSIGPDAINPDAEPSGPGCAECEASGGWWVHLRRCAACGHVGCCDSSPSQHATGHFTSTGHRVMQSYEPGEDWFFDFEQAKAFRSDVTLAEPTSHPDDQPAPGPKGRVPQDWRSQIHG